MKLSKIRIYYIAAVLLLLVLIVSNIFMGSADLSFGEIIRVLNEKETLGIAGRIIWYARLPRIFACVMAGAGLAVSGVVIQGVLMNHLASPGIIGVNAGAGLAVTLCCAFGTFSGWIIAGSAFLGAVISVLLVAVTAQKVGASRTTVILGGVAVNSCLTAISEAVSILIPEAGMLAADFRVGGFSAVAYTRLFPAGILILSGLLILFSLCNELDVLSLGEDTAHGLGMKVKNMRTIFLALAALLAGAVVSYAGLLGFVGLIVPHGARKLVGVQNNILLPFCALCGADLVLFCDLLARNLFIPYEVPVGIVMSVVGAPFFVFLLVKSKGGHRA